MIPNYRVHPPIDTNTHQQPPMLCIWLGLFGLYSSLVQVYDPHPTGYTKMAPDSTNMDTVIAWSTKIDCIVEIKHSATQACGYLMGYILGHRDNWNRVSCWRIWGHGSDTTDSQMSPQPRHNQGCGGNWESVVSRPVWWHIWVCGVTAMTENQVLIDILSWQNRLKSKEILSS